ncbi:MAG: LysM peptidoglycan-binding domain-containing protein [Deltaproteobacteria bacterium]|nr:LysM peptidoglycan-binding domain-containing protein [Deltaproteobacteria bacterium]MBW2695712.1 LysM peptidoglycan-binding domain-containing protein [Deltaproteobacteria bacterium]
MMRSRLLPAAALILALLAPASAGLAERSTSGWIPFPRPAALEPDVQFWTRIYTEVDRDGGLLHDSRDLAVVYEVIHLPDGLSRKGRQRYNDKRKDKYKRILRTLAGGKRSGLTAEERRVLELFPEDVSKKTLSAARSQVRFQLGQSDKFRAGLIRSGAYIGHIRATLDSMGLPRQIAALPHVESSYTPHAYSRIGAAGLWQFTRSTGRRYMRVDHVVDERLDPYRAGVAAARLLEQNLRVTGSWPLAITAYNHGASGMRRASRKLGTKDITRIVREYKSRTFGFASRNFYVEFLAAMQIAENPQRYFGTLILDQPIAYETVELPFYTTPEALAKSTGVSIESLKTANPALRPAVWRGQKRVPRGFELKIPRALLSQPAEAAIAGIPANQQFAKQTRDTYHVVRRGENLSRIAARYGVRVSELQRLNGLRSKHRIWAGQKLRLPSDHMPAQTLVRTSKEPIHPPADGLYTVRRGDTLSKIATRFGMSESDLMDANRLRNRNRIYVGQVLHVSAAVDNAIVAGAGPLADTSEPRAKTDSHPQVIAVLTPAHSASDEPETLLPGPVPTDEPEPDSDAVIVAQAAAVDDDARLAPGKTALLADPSDYSVASDGTIEVQANETLGHFAEWLGVRASRLRSINHQRYGEPLAVHGHLRLDFSRVTPEDFEQRRVGYHRALQEEFFAEWEIDGTEVHQMRSGDSLWVLSNRRFKVPLWLLQQYNPDLDFSALNAGTEITVPLLKRRAVGIGEQSASRTRPKQLG